MNLTSDTIAGNGDLNSIIVSSNVGNFTPAYQNCTSACNNANDSDGNCQMAYVGTALTQCLCQTSVLQSLLACATCVDNYMVSDNQVKAQVLNGFCNQCVTAGLQTSGSCSAGLPSNFTSLPYCPTPPAPTCAQGSGIDASSGVCVVCNSGYRTLNNYCVAIPQW